MKYILGLTAAVVLSMAAQTGQAANINSVIHKDRNVEKQNSRNAAYEGVKLANGVTMYANNPKALFADDAKTDVKTALLNIGVLRADTYTLNIKNENEMNYAVFADVAIGNNVLNRMTNAKHMSPDSSSLGALATAINYGDSPLLGNYTVKTPVAKQGNAYVGTLVYRKNINNNSYNEVLHIALTEDKYSGPNARFIAIDEASDSKVFPKVSELLTRKYK